LGDAAAARSIATIGARFTARLIDLINRRMTVSWGTCRRHPHSYGRFEEDSVWHPKQERQQQDMTSQLD
jgi:hypothetical protein